MSSVNLYNVLSVPKNCDKKTIKSAYRKLVKKYHPDKGGDSDLYELITHAYNILQNDEARKEYDTAMKVTNEAEHDFNSLQAGFKEFIEAQENGVTPEQKNEAIERFRKDSKRLDQEHGYERNDEMINEIPAEEARQMTLDLEMARDQDEIEYTQDSLFEEGQNFDASRFNEAWDRMHSGGSQLIKHDGNPLPWGIDDDSSFTSLNQNSLYEENGRFIYGTDYSSVGETNQKLKKISREDVKKMKGAEYTRNHTAGKDTQEYEDLLAQRMKERDLETKKFADMVFDDFKEDETMEGYGISHQIGLNSSSIVWENDDNVREQYHKMLEYRKNETDNGETKSMTKEEKRELRRQMREQRRKRNEKNDD